MGVMESNNFRSHVPVPRKRDNSHRYTKIQEISCLNNIRNYARLEHDPSKIQVSYPRALSSKENRPEKFRVQQNSSKRKVYERQMPKFMV